MKTCAFVFGERAELVVTSDRFFIQLGHLLFPREVGFCLALNGACKCTEKNMPSRRNGGRSYRLLKSQGSLCLGRSPAKGQKGGQWKLGSQMDLIRGLKFTIRVTWKNSAAECVASLISKASTD